MHGHLTNHNIRRQFQTDWCAEKGDNLLLTFNRDTNFFDDFHFFWILRMVSRISVPSRSRKRAFQRSQVQRMERISSGVVLRFSLSTTNPREIRKLSRIFKDSQTKPGVEKQSPYHQHPKHRKPHGQPN